MDQLASSIPASVLWSDFGATTFVIDRISVSLRGGGHAELAARWRAYRQALGSSRVIFGLRLCWKRRAKRFAHMPDNPSQPTQRRLGRCSKGVARRRRRMLFQPIMPIPVRVGSKWDHGVLGHRVLPTESRARDIVLPASLDYPRGRNVMY